MDSARDTPESATPLTPSLEVQPSAAGRGIASRGLGPWERLLLWLLATAAATGSLAWIVVQLQAGGVAPVVLMPLLTGLAVAASGEGLAHLTGIRPGRLWLVVACIAGVLVVAAEDSIDYYRYQGGYEKLLRSKPQMELFRTGSEQTGPAGFGRFMQIRLEKAPVWWPLDAALTVAAAVGWTVFRLRSFGQGEDEAGRNAPKE